MIIGVIGLLVGSFFVKRKGRSFRGGKREGFFVLSEKDGILGGGSGGKVD